MREELIDRLRAVNWEVTDEGDRMVDDPSHKCVFVDMRPDDFRALLREAADALEAMRKDSERWQKLRIQGGWPDTEAAMLGASPEDFDCLIDGL